jgi:hypothetical protein
MDVQLCVFKFSWLKCVIHGQEPAKRVYPVGPFFKLSDMKKYLTYHFVVLYLLGKHYVTHSVISLQASEGRGGPQGFSLKSN